ncbi:MAG: hypothetical protein IT366_21365 [Candidatus Hydrogenedentes bacterium]|nr:hypothetical protein [Candidatus Hydrogenedentota bacterium]
MMNEAKKRERFEALHPDWDFSRHYNIDDNLVYSRSVVEFAWQGYLARARHADEHAEKWLPIESASKDGTRVLVYYLNRSGKGRIAHAQYIPRFTEENWEDYAEYCEEKDVYYTPEGWYEICESWDDYSSMKLIYEPTHWRPLPPPPAAQEGGAHE